MISHTFSKIFGSVLQRIVSQYAESHGLYAPGQAGFRTGYSTTDHIFTLRCIIEEAKHAHRKVFCCFVDLRRAFDSIPRHLLLQRLLQLCFPSDILAAVVTIYERVLARFRDHPSLSPPIHSTIGVKQGCPLSPTLFALYIDELEDRKSTRLNSSHSGEARMPSSA